MFQLLSRNEVDTITGFSWFNIVIIYVILGMFLSRAFFMRVRSPWC